MILRNYLKVYLSIYIGMSDYSKGKIYRIWDNGFNKCYIGSTISTLSKRMEGHRAKYKQYKSGNHHYTTLFQLFDEYAVSNCKIELLETALVIARKN